MGAIIQSCNCTHAFQDAHYGRGMRVKNLTKGGSARCTVCSSMASVK